MNEVSHEQQRISIEVTLNNIGSDLVYLKEHLTELNIVDQLALREYLTQLENINNSLEHTIGTFKNSMTSSLRVANEVKFNS